MDPASRENHHQWIGCQTNLPSRGHVPYLLSNLVSSSVNRGYCLLLQVMAAVVIMYVRCLHSWSGRETSRKGGHQARESTWEPDTSRAPSPSLRMALGQALCCREIAILLRAALIWNPSRGVCCGLCSMWKHRKSASFKNFARNHTALNHSSPGLPNIEDTSIL